MFFSPLVVSIIRFHHRKTLFHFFHLTQNLISVLTALYNIEELLKKFWYYIKMGFSQVNCFWGKIKILNSESRNLKLKNWNLESEGILSDHLIFLQFQNFWKITEDWKILSKKLYQSTFKNTFHAFIINNSWLKINISVYSVCTIETHFI